MLPEDKFFLGDSQHCWSRYCSFLDLSVEEFMAIQERLLLEEIELVAKTPIAQKWMAQGPPKTVAEFRRTVPLTTYGDYEHFLGQQDEKALAEPAYGWCHTSGYGGRFKWVPFSQRAIEVQCRYAIAACLLAAAQEKGEVRVGPGDRVLFNVGPRPYFTGSLFSWLQEKITFHPIPPLEAIEGMTFREAVEKSFRLALCQGVDVVFSISSVLVRLGEAMAEGRRSASLPHHPRALYTLAQGLWRSKRQGRPLLPRDLWQPQAIIAGGTDTSIYKEAITHYWGRPPYEVYAATEGGLFAFQGWGNQEGLTLAPDVAFYEFIPEAQAQHRGPGHPSHPPTKLLSELKVGQSYEVVLTQFYGMPLLRYRLGDLITVLGKGDSALPQIAFKARADEILDLGGLVKLDERTLWRALSHTGVKVREWTVWKEFQGRQPRLHFYLELKEERGPEEMCRLLDEGLTEVAQSYREVEPILGFRPLRVTLLSPGTFQRYFLEREGEGAALGHLKPPHMSPSEAVHQRLLQLSQEGGVG